jgi:hypothetical protein
MFNRWFVYRGINHHTGEVYFGVSKRPDPRQAGFHCMGRTKALKHWDCWFHKINWTTLGGYFFQSDASAAAHRLERSYQHRKGYSNILTSGI